MTTELYTWLGTLVSIAVQTRTLAPSALPSGSWTDPDAVQETVQEWLEDKLLRGGLLQAFDRCESPRSFARYMEASLRNWLVSRSRRRFGPRLLERAAETLDDETKGYVVLSSSPTKLDRWWGLTEWGDEARLFTGDDGVVVAEAWALGDFAILRYSDSDRADPVLSSPDLERFVRGLLQRIGEGLSGRHFDSAFRGRFTFAYDQGSVGLEGLPEIASATSDESLEVTDAARIAMRNLTRRQVLVLLKRPEATLEALARDLGVSRGTVDNEYRRAMLVVREASGGDGQFDAVLEKVIEAASEGIHGNE